MAKSWTRCLAGALSYLHSIGIGHTNVTMSSLMLKTDEMQLQLTIPDQYVQAMGKSSAECTTGQKHKVNPYFAYEKMFANLHDVTLADVWQMGCIHYYALTLQHPFVRKKNAEFLQDIERKYWSFVGEYDTTSPRIDPSTKDFLSQIFTLEANRITSIEVLNHPYLASN